MLFNFTNSFLRLLLDLLIPVFADFPILYQVVAALGVLRVTVRTIFINNKYNFNLKENFDLEEFHFVQLYFLFFLNFLSKYLFV